MSYLLGFSRRLTQIFEEQRTILLYGQKCVTVRKDCVFLHKKTYVRLQILGITRKN